MLLFIDNNVDKLIRRACRKDMSGTQLPPARHYLYALLRVLRDVMYRAGVEQSFINRRFNRGWEGICTIGSNFFLVRAKAHP